MKNIILSQHWFYKHRLSIQIKGLEIVNIKLFRNKEKLISSNTLIAKAVISAKDISTDGFNKLVVGGDEFIKEKITNSKVQSFPGSPQIFSNISGGRIEFNWKYEGRLWWFKKSCHVSLQGGALTIVVNEKRRFGIFEYCSLDAQCDGSACDNIALSAVTVLWAWLFNFYTKTSI